VSEEEKEKRKGRKECLIYRDSAREGKGGKNRRGEKGKGERDEPG